MTVQKDTIFIQNLPKDVTNQDLELHFGSIGIIKNDKKTNQPKIWIYKDKSTGEGKGEATVTYDDDQAAKAAIEWFNGMILLLLVQFTKKKFNQRLTINLRQRSNGKNC